jgi:hypothetical protein
MEARVFALSHAILAPNPHNRQPWLVRLDGADALTLFVDRERLLPVTDPFSRQIVIGCGAFLELLSLAATARGRVAEVTPWPEGEPGDWLDARPVARARLSTATVRPDPLYAAIAERRSCKEVFDAGRTPTAAELTAVGQAAGGDGLRFAFANAPAKVAPLRELTTQAWYREMETPAAMNESVELMRIGRKQIAEHRDGIDLGGPMLETLAAVGVLTPEKLRTPGSIAFNQGKAMTKDQVDSTNAFAWLISEGADRSAQLRAGRAYARLNLAATRAGLAMHPLSQALQEFPEMSPFKAQADRLTGVRPGERLQMLVRVGYGPQTPPSPRRGLAEHMVT